MNARERFIATIKFEELDRPFRWEAPAVWPATIKQWQINEGLPEHITCSDITESEIYSHFDMDKLVWLPLAGDWIIDPYCPMFEKKTLDDDGEHLTIQDVDGIIKKIYKKDPDTSMPQFLTFPVETREDYLSKIQPKLDPSSKGRFPDNWNQLIEMYKNRDYPIGMFVIGPFGHLRNLFGDEKLMYLFFDNPELVHEIMKNWMNFYKEYIALVAKDVVPDFIMIWEDMCYNSGPLISPDFYKEYMAPCLKEVINVARSLNITGILVDNDGDCLKMLPIYLECGANGFYPFEVQCGMDVIEIRKQYGKKFAIVGGIDKRPLAANEAAIKKEVDKVVPFMLSQGGYIPMIDHSVPTNVTLKMFQYYVDYVRSIKV